MDVHSVFVDELHLRNLNRLLNVPDRQHLFLRRMTQSRPVLRAPSQCAQHKQQEFLPLHNQPSGDLATFGPWMDIHQSETSISHDLLGPYVPRMVPYATSSLTHLTNSSEQHDSRSNCSQDGLLRTSARFCSIRVSKNRKKPNLNRDSSGCFCSPSPFEEAACAEHPVPCPTAKQRG